MILHRVRNKVRGEVFRAPGGAALNHRVGHADKYAVHPSPLTGALTVEVLL
jgi:hypothetical protein